MFFRFVASLILVVLVSMVGIGLEKQTLEMKRAVSRQYFQLDLLLEMHARLRLQVQKLTAPNHLAKLEADSVNQKERIPVSEQLPPESTKPRVPSLPLLRWEHPVPAQDH